MKRGFSLVEVLFALVALSAGIVAIIMLMTTNIKTAVLAKNQVIAAELAQEGIELVRNIKDNDAAFFVAANFTVADNDKYRIDYKSTKDDLKSSKATFPTDPDKKLFINTDGFYDHVATGATTKFYRKIKIESVGATTNFAVTALVGWGPTLQTFDSNCNVANSCLVTTSIMTN